MLTQTLTVLAALAIPAALIAIVDDWFLRPRRRIAGGGTADAPLLAANYYLLPLLLLAALLRLLMSERLDFSLVLVIVVAVAGLVWLLDHLLFEPALRAGAARPRGGGGARSGGAAAAGHGRLRAQFLSGRGHRATGALLHLRAV